MSEILKWYLVCYNIHIYMHYAGRSFKLCSIMGKSSKICICQKQKLYNNYTDIMQFRIQFLNKNTALGLPIKVDIYGRPSVVYLLGLFLLSLLRLSLDCCSKYETGTGTTHTSNIFHFRVHCVTPTPWCVCNDIVSCLFCQLYSETCTFVYLYTVSSRRIKSLYPFWYV